MLNGVVDISKMSVYDIIISLNVVGVFEGFDLEFKNEYVVFFVYFDYIGFVKIVKKDNINNGVMDNVFGMLVMLEIVCLFSEMEEKLKCLILFVLVMGEEKGLLGVDYFVCNLIVLVILMVVNVNLDMLILIYEFVDVIVFGVNYSDL